jgi:lysophospholipase L1-like esterase
MSTMETARVSRIPHSILIASLCCSLAIITIIVFQQRNFGAALLAGFLSAIGILWLLKNSLRTRPRYAGWMLSIAVINLFVVVPELTLRAIDFRDWAVAPGIQLQGSVIPLIPDEALFWKVSPAATKVNSQGLPYAEVHMPKPPHTYRILYLGDSCTQQGYPLFVEAFLNADRPMKETQFDGAILALAGYSSHQGLVLAERYGRQLDPDLVVIYFGWNDHWLAREAPDAEKVVYVPRSRWEKITATLLAKSRLLQGVYQLATTLSGSRIDTVQTEVRVSPAQYRDNLLKMKAIFDERHVPVIFITAPTSHYQLGVPDDLVKRKITSTKQQAIAMHRQYNQIVRDLAWHTGAYLLDLESDFSDLKDPTQVFKSDGIHFVEEGLALVARRLTVFIERQVLPSQAEEVRNPIASRGG